MSTNLIAPIWNIPSRRNPFFTGREETLARLHDSLQRDATAALTQPHGLSGLGGIGKTQTALEYAYRYRPGYQAVLWARAETHGVLISQFVAIAHSLDLPEKDEQDQQLTIEAVMRWLRTHSHWLLILDNIEDLSIIAPFIPLAGRGHLLLTTRARALGGIAQRLEIEKMQPEVGALLLLRRASFIAPGNPLGVALENDRSQAIEISRVVDGLPLALDQAGAYIKQTNCSLSDYLVLYQIRSTVLLKEQSSVDLDYPESVATTWSLSFEKVKQANSAAAELLYLCAFLYPDAIPEEIIIDGACHLGPTLQPVASDPLQLDSALMGLLKFSLLHREPDSRTITIHRLVQAVLKSGMQNDTQRQWAERTVRAVNEALPEAEFTSWPVYERCILHAQECATHIEQWQMTFVEAARLLAQSGVYLHLRGQYREGVPLLQYALQICEQTQGAESSETSLCLHQLAELHRDLGEYELADRMYRRTLAIDQQRGSPDPLSRAASLQSYAVLCRIQGRFEEAETYFQGAQKIAEQVLGNEHPSVGTVLGNLALLYVNQGKYKEAEQLYLRSLAIAEQALGAEHPDTATALNTLAGFYMEQKLYAQARPLVERGLAIREKVSGPKHPYTGSALNNQAELYQAEGKHELSEQYYQRALAIAEQALGAEHPETASALNNLGFLYKVWEKHELAEQFYLKALAIRERVLGFEHTETASSYHNLAGLYFALSRYDEAEQFYQKALAIREHVLGIGHSDVGTTLNNLAMLYADQEKYEQAEQFYRRALLICETAFGPEHSDVAPILSNLAEIRLFQHDYKEAQDFFQRAMAIDVQTVGYESREVATHLYCLATVFYAQGHYEQAKRYYEDTIALCERVLEPTHPDLQMVRDAYAALLSRDRDDRYDDT